MSIRTLSRCGLALALAAVVSACSTGTGASGSAAASKPDAVCKWNRSKCMYEGPYEPGEKDYAEEEAARLNRAEAARLRRGFGW